MPTVSAVLLATVVLALGIALLARRRRSSGDERVRLYDMMRRRGVSPPAPAEPGAQDVAVAERRCAACANKEMCDELLRVGQTKGYDRFCPNALYIEWLRSNSLDFDLPPRGSAQRPD